MSKMEMYFKAKSKGVREKIGYYDLDTNKYIIEKGCRFTGNIRPSAKNDNRVISLIEQGKKCSKGGKFFKDLTLYSANNVVELLSGGYQSANEYLLFKMDGYDGWITYSEMDTFFIKKQKPNSLQHFKELLNWFVTQLNINNKIIPGDSTSGAGAQHQEIVKNYINWRMYDGFSLNCTIRTGAQSHFSGANYIHYFHLNINPEFDESDKVAKLVIKNSKDGKEILSKDVNDLGLNDVEVNESLKSFFEEYQTMIKKEKECLLQKPEGKEKNDGGKGSPIEHRRNQILYGPPGTGKTYNSVVRAVAICENRKLSDIEQENYSDVLQRYNELKENGYIEFITFHQSYGYEEFIQGIKPAVADNGQVVYKVEDGIFKAFCDNAKGDENNYVFIIDEINRGNVSKIFGELITLIEESKRIGKDEEKYVKLPYTGEEFGVPDNVYILGTMNTADRSLVQLDAALRRRFRFIEMMPEAGLLTQEVKDENGKVTEIKLKDLLTDINERICALIDREHQIGHSYFMKVKTIDDLRETFQYEIIPLLQEYFYDDYENILQVLNNQLIIKEEPKKLGDVDYKTYTINAKDASADAFKKICKTL